MTQFRLVDLVTTVAIAAALLGVTAAARRQAQEVAVIVQCQQNLRQIAQSLVMYQSLNAGQFPRTRYRPDAPLTAYTGADAPDPFAAAGPAENDTTAALWLLAREMELPPATFVCPAAQRHGLAEADQFDRRSAWRRSNFYARVNDNYSLANMYPTAAAAAAGYSLDSFHEKLPATFAIAGDTNPGLEDERNATTQQSRVAVRMTNSPNHQRDGQNILFADGSVGYFGSPFAGSADDVYLAADNGLQPLSAADSVLVPTWSEGPQRTTSVVQNRRWVLGASAVFVFAVLFVIVRRGMRRASAER